MNVHHRPQRDALIALWSVLGRPRPEFLPDTRRTLRRRALPVLWARADPLAVTLSFMSDTKHVVVIHGAWSRGQQLAPARAAFEERGYTAHTPTLRHHELPCARVL